MNSYPSELLAQLAPVMFAAGLDGQPQGKTPDQFAVLTARLRDALAAQRKGTIWQPEKLKAFQVVVVDKDVRFPPRKLLHPDDPQYNASHSPLSPLTPTSPLYPDGLIAPIWIRKHTTLVPSVFVLFTRIFEYFAPATRGPLDVPDVEREREREAEERRKDGELATEIAQRKRSTNERGIKLTVVLMASRRMLDDPALDARLTFIRRQSGLDPRAALFVLSPVSLSEIGDFVQSLQEALYEPAIEYYTNHSKRVRRKRNRHSQSAASYTIPHSPLGTQTATRPLRPEGWTVRYEYKMACFAEFRGEDEVALKHFQDAYAALLTMIGSTAILPPRTKRWAEAKVLADCISVKICKLYLYNNEHALALSHHNSHMRKFADFSRGWGIGEETYEFWSWLARQHRAFAELLELGTHTTLVIPTHFVTPGPTAAEAAVQALEGSQRNIAELDAMRVLGLNPSQALQHPGFYFYMSARCTERRRDRFLTAIESETSANSSPGFTNEKKVDHLTVILEMYTRSYELFKKYNPTNGQAQGRLIMWLAYRIAHTYQESGKFDLAVKFYERIAKTYRRERWDMLLRPLLSTWYTCVQQMGDMELSVRLLFEMLGYGVSTTDDDPDAAQEDLLAVLRSSVPSTPDQPFVIDSSESEPLLQSCVVFWKPEVIVGEAVAYQITLTAPLAVSISALPFSSLAIHFHGDIPPLTVRHSPIDLGELPAVQKVDLGHVSLPLSESDDNTVKEVEGALQWCAGSSIVLCGTIASDEPVVIKISKLVLTLNEASWTIEIPIHPVHSQEKVSSPCWLLSIDPVQHVPIRSSHYSFATVRHRRHAVQVSLVHSAPAHPGEKYPIDIEVRNIDNKDLDTVVDVLLQPLETDEAVSYITFGDERSTSLIKGTKLGILAPGVSTVKTLFLGCEGSAGNRVIDISIQSRTVSVDSEPDSPLSIKSHSEAIIDRSESLHTLVIPVEEPMRIEHTISYRRSLKPQPGLADLRTFDSDFWDDGDGGEAIVNFIFTCSAPSGLLIESLHLIRKDGQHAKVIDYSLESDLDDYPMEWLPGDEIADRCRITMAPGEQHLYDEAIPGPGEYEMSWRRMSSDGSPGTLTMSRFPLPPLRPPVDELVALLDVPPTAKLHVPIELHLTVRNRHPSRAANIVVQLDPDAADGFVIAGLRSGRMPILLPGGEEGISWKLIPVVCGFVKVPRVRVTNRRKAGAIVQTTTGQAVEPEIEGDVVRIVDVRWDQRSDSGEEVPRVSLDLSADVRSKGSRIGGEPTVLVLP